MKPTITVIKMPDFGRIKLTADEMGKAALAGGHVIEANAKINANNVFSSNATNTLAGSIQTVLKNASANHAETSTGPSVVYGRIQELGGTIKPVHAKMLHWISDTGEHIFANVVHLPPRPYLRPAVDEHKDDIGKAVAAQIRKFITRRAG